MQSAAVICTYIYIDISYMCTDNDDTMGYTS